VKPFLYFIRSQWKNQQEKVHKIYRHMEIEKYIFECPMCHQRNKLGVGNFKLSYNKMKGQIQYTSSSGIQWKGF
jgi:hypothetical protein